MFLRNGGLSPNYTALNPEDCSLRSHRHDSLKSKDVVFVCSSYEVREVRSRPTFLPFVSADFISETTKRISIKCGVVCLYQ
jgi:hypothetical protein